MHSNDVDQSRFWEKISLIAEIASVCRRGNEEGETYLQVFELIRPLIPFEAVVLYLRRGKEGTPYVAASWGDTAPFVPEELVSTANAAASKSPADYSDGSFSLTASTRANPYRSRMATPLLIDRTIIGWFCLGCAQSDALVSKHVRLMDVIADQLALSIERRAYERAIVRRNQALWKLHERLQIAQEKIIEAEKLSAVTELAVSINHEINNPLTVIVGNVQCLKMPRYCAQDQLANRLERIETAAMSIAAVNRKLLKIDKLVAESYLAPREEKMLDLDQSISQQEEMEVTE